MYSTIHRNNAVLPSGAGGVMLEGLDLDLASVGTDWGIGPDNNGPFDLVYLELPHSRRQYSFWLLVSHEELETAIAMA